MKDSMIFRSRLRRWFFVFGIFLGAGLVQLTFAAPAYAADLGLPYGGGYGPRYAIGGYGPRYAIGGYGVGCGSHCGCGYCGCGHPCGCGVSCFPPVIERRFVVRSYYERRLPYCCGYGGYGGFGGGGYGGGGFGGGGFGGGGYGGYGDYGGAGFGGGGFGGGGFGGYGGYYPSTAYGGPYGGGYGFDGY
jgi:hypothetical protein